MEFTLLHPKIVHLPIALALVVPFVAAGILFAWRRGWYRRRVWVIAIALQAILVAGGGAALQTGEIDEERVELVVAESHIEAHEESSEVFFWAAVIVLGIALGVLFVPGERFAQLVASMAVVGTLIVFGLGYRAGESGGKLVYEEGAANAFISAESGKAQPQPKRESEQDSD